MLRYSAIGLLTLLGACSQQCDCENKQQPVNQVQSSMENTVSTEQEFSPQMREAPPAESEFHSSQLDQVLADPNARPFLSGNHQLMQTMPTQQARSPQLVRKLLPSEVASLSQNVALDGAMSTYPALRHNKQQLTDYANQLVFKLAGFEKLKGAKVGVTSFVEFDQSLQQTNALGNQFAEAIVSLLPQYGVEVIEFKLTRQLAIGSSGDLALSRQVKQLNQQVGMDYLLTGTMVTTGRGVQINSRVVSVRQQKVIAAATTLLPHLVLQQIQP